MSTTVRKTLLSASVAALLTVALLPGAAADEVAVNPTVNVRPDTEEPSESTGYASADTTARAGDVWVTGDTTVNVGEYTVCSGFFCSSQDGHKATTYQHAEAGGETATVQGTLTLVEDDSEPAGYRVGTVSAGCSHNGQPC